MHGWLYQVPRYEETLGAWHVQTLENHPQVLDGNLRIRIVTWEQKTAHLILSQHGCLQFEFKQHLHVFQLVFVHCFDATGMDI